MGKRTSAFAGMLMAGAILAASTLALWGCAGTQTARETGPGNKAAGAPISDQEQKSLQSEQQAAELQNTDCLKCHDKQPANIKASGGKHRDKVGCRSCHLEHLPLGKKTIPQCNMCHNDPSKGHFKLANCLGCHRNPHTPLDITVEDTPVTAAACLTCHAPKGEEFKANPSKHAQKNCTFCHPTKHKAINKCLACHKPHAEFMVYEDCLKCHKPHSPLNIHYAADIPSKYCGACHGEIAAMLAKSTAKHAKLNCAFCHKDKHPTVPKCADCHAQPHSQAMLTTFKNDCLKCHNNPHDIMI